MGYVLSVKSTDKTSEQLEEESGYRLDYLVDVIDESPLLNEDLFFFG